MNRVPCLLALLLLLAAITSPTASSADDLPLSADSIHVGKTAHRLELFHHGRLLKTYRVALGRGSLGAKERAGDQKTPEGHYRVDFHKYDSAYHLALHLTYPNAADHARALAAGVDPGGSIMIHGLPKGWGWIGRLHVLKDWTDGCIAVTDEEIEEISRAVKDGTPIEITH